MSPKEALTIVTKFTENVTANRQTHLAVMEALQVLDKALSVPNGAAVTTTSAKTQETSSSH